MIEKLIESLTTPEAMANGGVLALFGIIVAFVAFRTIKNVTFTFNGEKSDESGRIEVRGALISDEQGRMIEKALERNTHEMQKMKDTISDLRDDLGRNSRSIEESSGTIRSVNQAMNILALELRGNR